MWPCQRELPDLGPCSPCCQRERCLCQLALGAAHLWTTPITELCCNCSSIGSMPAACQVHALSWKSTHCRGVVQPARQCIAKWLVYDRTQLWKFAVDCCNFLGSTRQSWCSFSLNRIPRCYMHLSAEGKIAVVVTDNNCRFRTMRYMSHEQVQRSKMSADVLHDHNLFNVRILCFPTGTWTQLLNSYEHVRRCPHRHNHYNELKNVQAVKL